MLHNQISLVIPTRNDEKFLKLLLISINNQTFHPQEIIIVDSSTNQATNNTIKKLDVTIPIIYHREKKAYPGKARNIGVKMAKMVKKAVMKLKEELYRGMMLMGCKSIKDLSRKNLRFR